MVVVGRGPRTHGGSGRARFYSVSAINVQQGTGFEGRVAITSAVTRGALSAIRSRRSSPLHPHQRDRHLTTLKVTTYAPEQGREFRSGISPPVSGSNSKPRESKAIPCLLTYVLPKRPGLYAVQPSECRDSQKPTVRRHIRKHNSQSAKAKLSVEQAVKVVSLTRRPPIIPRKIYGTNFS
jgi:hypothetical protein